MKDNPKMNQTATTDQIEAEYKNLVDAMDDETFARESKKMELNAIHLTMLLGCQFILQRMDKLIDTNAYRGPLKQAGNRFKNELIAAIEKELVKSLDVDNNALYSAMTWIEEYIRIGVRRSPEDLAVLKEFVKQYEENPVQVMKSLRLKFIDSDQIDEINDEIFTLLDDMKIGLKKQVLSYAKGLYNVYALNPAQ